MKRPLEAQNPDRPSPEGREPMANVAEIGEHIACGVCAMKSLCHGRGAVAVALSPVECRRALAAGETLYDARSPQANVYALRAGFVKLAVLDATGGNHIVRFLLPGDVAGLDAFAGDAHSSAAIVLEDCEVCQIPVYRLELLAEYQGRIRAHLHELLARELADAQGHAAALAGLTAAQRVAGFLIEFSRRWTVRGFSGTEFRLPMGRRELGEHLGLTMESVSRILSDFRALGCIALPRGGMKILSPAMLKRILAPVPPH